MYHNKQNRLYNELYIFSLPSFILTCLFSPNTPSPVFQGEEKCSHSKILSNLPYFVTIFLFFIFTHFFLSSINFTSKYVPTKVAKISLFYAPFTRFAFCAVLAVYATLALYNNKQPMQFAHL